VATVRQTCRYALKGWSSMTFVEADHYATKPFVEKGMPELPWPFVKAKGYLNRRTNDCVSL
jgi:hypothetical protein